VAPPRRFDVTTHNHPHRACASNASTRRELQQNRKVKKTQENESFQAWAQGLLAWPP
jgi:hypothetical protein